MKNPHLPMSAGWLQKFADEAEKRRVLEIAHLTALKQEAGVYYGANFERALLLRHLLRTLRPQRILELGTGRGLGSLAMADVLEREGLRGEITSIDIIPPTTPQRWPICEDGKFSTPNLSLNAVWEKHFSTLRKYMTLKTGSTTRILPQLAADGHRYDFIFIDAGHDVFSVFHDFSYSTTLLTAGGSILMDDFDPLQPFGLATCMVTAHAPRYYESVKILETEGTVFESTAAEEKTHGMVFLSGKKEAEYQIQPLLLQIFRIFGKIIELAWNPRFFPLKK